MRKSNLPLSRRSKSSRSEISTGILLDLKTLSPHQTKTLIHELQVHQIELKSQNEELRRTQAELDASHARYFNLYDLAPVGYITVDENGLILECNFVAATMLGVPKGTLVKQPLTRFVFKEDQDHYYKHRKQLMGNGGPQTVELRMVKKDGSRLWVQLDSIVVHNIDGMAVCCVVVNDITERKRAEERIRKMNRVYAMLSNTNMAIVRIREPQALFTEVCRIAVKEGGFKMAWIGMADPVTGKVTPAASAGDTGGYLEKKHIVLDDKERENCSAGKALKAGECFVCNDVEKSPCMAPWRKDVLNMGFHSCAAFPLKVSGQVVGALELFAAEAGFFDEEELKLLDELAMDISFAMEFAEKEAKRKLAEKQLIGSETRYRRLFEAAKDGILILDSGTGMVVDVNPFLVDLLGYSKDRFLGRHLWEIGAFKDILASRESFLELQDKKYIRYENLPLETAYGRTINVEFVSNVYLVNGGKVIQCNIRDITERKRAEEREQLTRNVLDMLNRSDNILEAISEIVKLIKMSTGIEAIGIRLRNGDDFPYYETNGFPGHFVEAERSLCAYDENGEVIRDKAGNPVLECMCGNVIRGRTDPTKPFFTKGGSFWSNCTTELLASTSEKDRQARTRNRCNGEGYESVALVPLCAGKDIVGLLQFNDHQKGRFAIETIRFFEGFGAVIGIALARKLAEETLRHEKNFSTTIVNTTQAIILVLDSMGRIVQFNQYLEEISGYSLDEVRGKDWFDTFLPVAERSDIRISFRNAIQDIPTRGKVSTIITKDGSERKIEWYDKTLKNAESSIIGLLSTGLDITERKKAEEDLVFKNIILSTQQDASIDGILVVDGNGIMISFNRRFIDMWGIPQDVIESKSDERAQQSVIDKHTDPEEFMRKVKYLYEARKETSRDDIMLKDGRTFDRYSAPMLGAEGKYYGRVWYFRDITERKQAEAKQKKLEEQLRQSQKLEAIGQLSSGVAHDFNNLLGGIMGHAEILKMNLDPESPLLHHPEVIISSCEKAADLTRQLLAFARKASVELQKIDLNAFLKQVVRLMDRTIDHRIEIVTNIQEQPAFISGDRNQLENALLNIAINARDAMPEGGHLCIKTETVDLNRTALPDEHGEVAEGAYVKILMADTGTGMSKEIKEHIFEPFFTTKEVGKGTGLGLASVYGCVKQHNGYITVQSQEGKGTQFDLYFPIAASTGPIASQKSEILVRGKGTLLVVDDEPVYHEILTKIFMGLGYTVYCCAKGAEAVEYYREHSSMIQVVILDMNMPKMSGLSCYKHLKKIDPEVRVIVASGYGDNSDREAMKKQGVRAFVQKPYKTVELSMKIAELVNAT